mgnify:CR=1 FL=1|tara:strand:- start:538 stop:771 length:234 start_codon:yes stop_codon:yes gene_type:complete
MLQGILVKKIVDIIMKQFKLDEVNKQINSIQRSVNKYGKYIEEMEKDIAEIKAIAHKPVDGLNDRLDKLEKKLKLFK